ncbi:hypothetical protein [Legionella pneumophila]|uniref:hypothetical protein n=1 Tax=Legionella pneumophila TaxID=446 RepID=UPI0010AA1619|nr:hypothetical protein [Legionella pneumophila]TIG84036.1 hypothetical protein DI110_12145 [Legionella pneumophila]HAT8773707.1 hypothetical protein [Legionella pneumophila]HAU2192741.1 hypothetical protein [Legionella pneumophila]
MSQDIIFNFQLFISSLPMMIVIYTILDKKYDFTLTTAIIPFKHIVFYLIIAIGIFLLSLDLFISEQHKNWRGFLAFIYFLIPILWIFFVFISPSRFGKWNANRYLKNISDYIMKGGEHEFDIIASDLNKNIDDIVMASTTNNPCRYCCGKSKNDTKLVANAILKIIGNRRFCHYLITHSPSTAINILVSLEKHGKYDEVIDPFIKLIFLESLFQKESLIYYEDKKNEKSLISLLFGNKYLMLSGESRGLSPLQIDFSILKQYDAQQLTKYCDCLLVYFESNIDSLELCLSEPISKSLDSLWCLCRDLHLLNNSSKSEYFHSFILIKYFSILNFSKSIIDAFGKLESNRGQSIDLFENNVLNEITQFLLQLIEISGSISKPPELCRAIHEEVLLKIFLFSSNENGAKSLKRRLRRLIYNNIKKLSHVPHYYAANILGFCLNSMGLEYNKFQNKRGYNQLHKAILKWVAYNYWNLYKVNPEIARACLHGDVAFDSKKSQLTRVFLDPIKGEEKKETLKINKNNKRNKFYFLRK